MRTHDFNKFILTNGGNYSPTQNYEKYTYVRYNSGFWISKQSTLGNTPERESIYWKYLCSDCSNGDEGIPNLVRFTLYVSEWEKYQNYYRYDLQDILDAIFGEEDITDKHMDIYLDLSTATNKEITYAEACNIIGASDRYIYSYTNKSSFYNIPVVLVYY